MEETFAFVAPVMPRRQLNRLALQAGLLAAVFVAAVGSLGVYVVEHEQAADAVRAALEARVAAAEQARLEATVAGVEVPESLDDTVDQASRAAADEALGYAQAAFADDGSFANAGPGQLATERTDLLFVDGPSTSPQIVSVAATAHAWAAAVNGPGGCSWIVLRSSGNVSRGTGGECTGSAVLAAAPPA